MRCDALGYHSAMPYHAMLRQVCRLVISRSVFSALEAYPLPPPYPNKGASPSLLGRRLGPGAEHQECAKAEPSAVFVSAHVHYDLG